MRWIKREFKWRSIFDVDMRKGLSDARLGDRFSFDIVDEMLAVKA